MYTPWSWSPASQVVFSVSAGRLVSARQPLRRSSQVVAAAAGSGPWTARDSEAANPAARPAPASLSITRLVLAVTWSPDAWRAAISRRRPPEVTVPHEIGKLGV